MDGQMVRKPASVRAHPVRDRGDGLYPGLRLLRMKPAASPLCRLFAHWVRSYKKTTQRKGRDGRAAAPVTSVRQVDGVGGRAVAVVLDLADILQAHVARNVLLAGGAL